METSSPIKKCIMIILVINLGIAVYFILTTKPDPVSSETPAKNLFPEIKNPIPIPNAKINKTWHVSDWCILPDIEDLPGDTMTPTRGLGSYINDSAYRRGWNQSEQYLHEFEQFVIGLTDNELLLALAKTGRNYNRAEYSAALIGNKIIFREISKRHIMRPLEFDDPMQYFPMDPQMSFRQSVYTGASGPKNALPQYFEALQKPYTGYE